MKVKAILWDYHETKDKKYPIRIRITNTHQGKTDRKYIPVDFSVNLNQWDQKMGRVKADKHPNAPAINLKIVEQITTIEKNILAGFDPFASAVAKVDENTPADEKQNVYWWFDERIKYSYQKHSIHTVEKFGTVRNALQEYAKTLTISDLTYKFLCDYEIYMLKQGYHPNTVADHFVRLRIITNEMRKAKYLKYDDSPFREYKITFKKTKRDRLQLAEFSELQTLKIPILTHNKKHDSVRLIVNMYIFAFDCNSMRWGDICRLKESNIKDGRLRYTMHKTEIEKNVTLSGLALEIIDYVTKYKKEKGITGPYLFPTGFYAAKNNTKEEEHKESKSVDARNSFFRKKLHLACKWAGIPEISFHTNRHLLADEALKAGVSMRALQELLGHGRITTTEIYTQSSYPEMGDAAMAKIRARVFKKGTDPGNEPKVQQMPAPGPDQTNDEPLQQIA